MDIKGLTRIGASVAGLFMFWLTYVLFAFRFGSQFPYGATLISWMMEPLYVSFRMPAIASVTVVSSALTGIVLLDYAITGKLNL